LKKDTALTTPGLYQPPSGPGYPRPTPGFRNAWSARRRAFRRGTDDRAIAQPLMVSMDIGGVRLG
jgi:hypothetical protein